MTDLPERRTYRSLIDIETDIDRARTAFHMRSQGHDYYTIAEELDLVNPKTAERLVLQYLENHVPDEDVSAVRRMEVARLDQLTNVFLPMALTGNNRAAETMLAVMDRRAKLLGLDAPLKVDIDAEIRAIALQLEIDQKDLMYEVREVKKELEGR